MTGIPKLPTSGDLIRIALDKILKLVKPDVDAIVATFLKAQRKLETVIERELQQTANDTQAIEDAYAEVARLMSSRDARNATIDRAYRIIHNLSTLTA